MTEQTIQPQVDGSTFDIYAIFNYVKKLLATNYPNIDISSEQFIRLEGQKKFSIYLVQKCVLWVEYLKSVQKFSIQFASKYRSYLAATVDTTEMSGNKTRIYATCLDDLRALDNVICKIFEDSVHKNIGCCSSYLECSDALHCVNPDPAIFLHCYYRANLNNGIIFYGKNKNH